MRSLRPTAWQPCKSETAAGSKFQADRQWRSLAQSVIYIGKRICSYLFTRYIRHHHRLPPPAARVVHRRRLRERCERPAGQKWIVHLFFKLSTQHLLIQSSLVAKLSLPFFPFPKV